MFRAVTQEEKVLGKVASLEKIREVPSLKPPCLNDGLLVTLIRCRIVNDSDITLLGAACILKEEFMAPKNGTQRSTCQQSDRYWGGVRVGAPCPWRA